MAEKKIVENVEPKKSDTPACCIGCIRWQQHGKSCWYYWEGKKHCTVWTDTFDQLG